MRKTKNYIRLILVLTAALMSASCYDSKTPMDTSESSVIDLRLIGHWKGEWKWDEDKPAQPIEFTIYKFTEHEYYVKYQAGHPGEIERFNLRAYTVTVGGTPFINVQGVDELIEKERKFSFYNYSLSPDGKKLTLRIVSEDLFDKEIETSAKLREFIQKNLENKKLYEDPIVFDKVSPEAKP